MNWGLKRKLKLAGYRKTIPVIPPERWIGWEPVGIGDFNGGGVSDILWRHTVTGKLYIQIIVAKAVSTEGVLTTLPNHIFLTAGDFDGNGRHEIMMKQKGVLDVAPILLYPDATGFGLSATQILSRVILNYYSVPYKASRNTQIGGRASLILRSQRTVENIPDYLWCFNVDGFTVTAEAPGGSGPLSVPLPTWQMVGHGDFNSDGAHGVFWFKDIIAANKFDDIAIGETYIYALNGSTILGTSGYSRTVSDIPNYKIVGSGQFDALLGWDILFRRMSFESGQPKFYVYTLDNAGLGQPFITANEGYISNEVQFDGYDIIGIGNFGAGGNFTDVLFWNKDKRICKISSISFAFVGTGAINFAFDAGTTIPNPTGS